ARLHSARYVRFNRVCLLAVRRGLPMVCVHTVPARPPLALPAPVWGLVGSQCLTCVSLPRMGGASLCPLPSLRHLVFCVREEGTLCTGRCHHTGSQQDAICSCA